VVTVQAELMAPDEPLVLNDLPDKYECIVEETVVVCFNVTLCFNYSLLPEDSVDRFSKNPVLFTKGLQLFQIMLDDTRNLVGITNFKLFLYIIL